MDRKIVTQACALFVGVLMACTNVVTEKELVGVYVNTAKPVDSLEIRSDGTCEFWTFVPGQKLAFSGSWEFEPQGAELKLIGVNFPFIEDSGELSASVKGNNGTVVLMIPEMKPNYFQRVER